MKLKLLLLLLCICSLSFAQEMNETELTGTWNVDNVRTNITSVSKEQQVVIDELIMAFENATFQFNENRDFKISIDYEDISNKIKNAYWKLDAATSVATIVDWEDKETDEPSWEWPISISKKGEKTYFTLLGANFELEVIKQ